MLVHERVEAKRGSGNQQAGYEYESYRIALGVFLCNLDDVLQGDGACCNAASLLGLGDDLKPENVFNQNVTTSIIALMC